MDDRKQKHVRALLRSVNRQIVRHAQCWAVETHVRPDDGFWPKRIFVLANASTHLVRLLHADAILIFDDDANLLISRIDKAEMAEVARKAELEFPPGKPIPPGILAEATTLGEYLDSQGSKS